VKSLGQEMSKNQGVPSDYDGLCEKIQHFSALVEKVMSNEDVVNDIIMALSRIFSETSEIKFTMLRDSTKETDSNNLDYVDKVTLLENKVQLVPLKDNISVPYPLIGWRTDAGFDVKMCSPS
jgi:hypothetical protein